MFNFTLFPIKAGCTERTRKLTTVGYLALAGLVSSTARLEPSAFGKIICFIYKTRQLIIQESCTEPFSSTCATLSCKQEFFIVINKTI